MWENFIGQNNLKHELLNLRPFPVSILLRGNSGYGKTTLAKLYASARGNYDYQEGSNLEAGFKYNSKALTHIIDEIHEIKTPEMLYPFLDAGMTFVLCSNETANIKEPLRNRCVERFFDDYTDDDLLLILKTKNNDLSLEIMKLIVNRCRGIPRTLLQLSFLIRANCPDLSDIDNIRNYLNSTGVYENGFTKLDMKYLDFIKKAKRASLNTIVSNINLPLSQVKDEIEPYLIRKGLISISSLGRNYIG